jgi:hypothetical protein
MRFDWMFRETLTVGSSKRMPTATQVRWRRPARVTRGNRTIGGTLSATTTQLVHTPDRFNAPGNRSPTEVSFDQIAAISVQERTYARSTREMRRRLRIDCRDGNAQLFVVEDPGGAARELSELAAGDPPTSRMSSSSLYDAWIGQTSSAVPRRRWL